MVKLEDYIVNLDLIENHASAMFIDLLEVVNKHADFHKSDKLYSVVILNSLSKYIEFIADGLIERSADKLDENMERFKTILIESVNLSIEKHKEEKK